MAERGSVSRSPPVIQHPSKVLCKHPSLLSTGEAANEQAEAAEGTGSVHVNRLCFLPADFYQRGRKQASGLVYIEDKILHL